MSQTYSPKDPAEVIPLAWDFAPLLSTGETIDSVTWELINPEVGDAVVTGVFPDGPAILGSVVKQRFAAGENGVSYQHRITVTTNLGNVYVEKPTQLVTSEPE